MSSNPSTPAATSTGSGCLVVVIIFAVLGLLGATFGDDDEVTPAPTYPTDYQPQDEIDRQVQDEVQCLEAAYDRYEANPAAFPDYSNELDYADALCNE